MPNDRIHMIWFKGSYHFFLERDVETTVRIPICNVCHSMESRLFDSENGFVCEKCLKALRADRGA